MIQSILNYLFGFYQREPAVVLGAVASAVVFVAALVGVVVPQTDVLTALAYVVPIILGFLGIRSKVTPV